jgi:hypothetical protein
VDVAYNEAVQTKEKRVEKKKSNVRTEKIGPRWRVRYGKFSDGICRFNLREITICHLTPSHPFRYLLLSKRSSTHTHITTVIILFSKNSLEAGLAVEEGANAAEDPARATTE